ncbi:MAG: hypothetical protein HYS98_08910 [Deltaproteobacteria bacterium]|nr:hypothetical protein [Deltaproteobacteria bacterium]
MNILCHSRTLHLSLRGPLYFCIFFCLSLPLRAVPSSLIPDSLLQKVLEGEIVSSTYVEEVPDDRRRLSVTSVGLVKKERDKLRKIFDDPQLLQSLSKKIKKVDALQMNRKNRIFMIQACFLFCSYKIHTAVHLDFSKQKKDQDNITWKFLSGHDLSERISNTQFEDVDFKFSGMKGSTVLKVHEKNSTLVGLEGQWDTSSSSFFRWVQKWLIKTALTQTIYEIRSNLEEKL